MRCGRCGLLRTWPVPSADVLTRLYEDASYHEVRTDGSPKQWAARATQIIDALPRPPDAVLDFGAGEGHLVRAFRDAGIAAAGVEPSAGAREAAIRHQDIELLVDLDHVAASRFTTITLLHVLEHVEDPVGTLRTLRRALEPDGHMFIEVPHAGSADMIHAQTRRAILDPPAHLHHFTPATLRPLVERAGLSVVATFLFNARPIEAALAWRNQRRSDRNHGRPTLAAGRAPLGAYDAGHRTSHAEQLLALTRAALPGRKFQLVVRVDD